MNQSDDLSGPAISKDESRRRKEAVTFARHSVALSGFTLTPEVEQLGRRFIAGELTSDEHIQAIKLLYR